MGGRKGRKGKFSIEGLGAEDLLATVRQYASSTWTWWVSSTSTSTAGHVRNLINFKVAPSVRPGTSAGDVFRPRTLKGASDWLSIEDIGRSWKPTPVVTAAPTVTPLLLIADGMGKIRCDTQSCSVSDLTCSHAPHKCSISIKRHPRAKGLPLDVPASRDDSGHPSSVVVSSQHVSILSRDPAC
jgi:hypothetical protein